MNDNKLKNINSSLIERNKQFLVNRSNKIRSAVTQRELECTFAPKINQVENEENHIDSSATGQRLYDYSQKYSINREVMKENSKEVFSFKPNINKNTDTILKNRENYLELLRKKFDNKLKWKADSISNKTENNNDSQSNKEINYEETKKVFKETNDIVICNVNFEKQSIKDVLIVESKVDSERSNEERPLKREIYNKINTKIKYNDSPLKIQRENSAHCDSSNLLNNNNRTKFKNPYYLEKLTDGQLLVIANDYITTDESLDKFNKFGINNCKEDIKKQENLEKDYEKKSSNQNSLKRAPKKLFISSEKNKNVTELPKNVKNALDYFKLAEK